jgi:hypothetical protein
VPPPQHLKVDTTPASTLVAQEVMRQLAQRDSLSCSPSPPH